MLANILVAVSVGIVVFMLYFVDQFTKKVLKPVAEDVIVLTLGFGDPRNRRNRKEDKG